MSLTAKDWEEIAAVVKDACNDAYSPALAKLFLRLEAKVEAAREAEKVSRERIIEQLRAGHLNATRVLESYSDATDVAMAPIVTESELRKGRKP